MKAIDNFRSEIVSLENGKKFLNEQEYENFVNFNTEMREDLLRNLLEKPIDEFTEINELYFRWKWSELFNILYGKDEICLLEVASGDADMIPQSLSVSNPNSKYITANMNKALNESLIRKTKDLNINLVLIDDDAGMITEYIKEREVDIIAFQHGVNDVLQGILCAKNDVDTVNCDWMECLPKMIELVKNEVSNNSFNESLKEPFLNLLKTLALVLKTEGLIAISHYMFQLDLDLGYPREIFEDLILIVRKWLVDNDEFEEVFYDGFDNQWWIFFKKKMN